MKWVADVVDIANAQMDDPHFAIGPSHFMRPDLSEEWVEMIWEFSITPYLEERFFGTDVDRSAYGLAALRSSIIAAARLSGSP